MGPPSQEWPVDGVPPVHAGPIRADGREAGFLADVLRTGETVSIDGTNGHTAPMFAGLRPGRRAIAVPFVLDGRPVPCCMPTKDSDGQPLASWLRDGADPRSSRHVRRVIADRDSHGAGAWASSRGSRSAPAADDSVARLAPPDEDEIQGARRYATAAGLGNQAVQRRRRARRTRAPRSAARVSSQEIDRARRLYEQRIGASVPDRESYFQQELVQTLADGDASLLE